MKTIIRAKEDVDFIWLKSRDGEKIDFEKLLVKYMHHVADYEGATFVSYLSKDEFTEEEIDILEKISEVC